MKPPAVCFVARSGTGKTTLMERVIQELVGRGHRVGAVKHHGGDFEIDMPGKDSHRLGKAGATVTAISSPGRLAVMRRGPEIALEDLLERFFGEVDVVLAEGYKSAGLPKIEVLRGALGGPLLTRERIDDPTLLAVVSDKPVEVDVPVLGLDDPAVVADFIEKRVMRLPGPGGPTAPAE